MMMTWGESDEMNKKRQEGGGGGGTVQAADKAEETSRDHIEEGEEDQRQVNPAPVTPALEVLEGDGEEDGEGAGGDTGDDLHDSEGQHFQAVPVPLNPKRSRPDVSSLLQFVSVAGCDIRAALDKSAPCKRSVDHRKYLQKQLCRFSSQQQLHQQQQCTPCSPTHYNESPYTTTTPNSSSTVCRIPPSGEGVSAVVVAAPMLNATQEEEGEEEEEELEVGGVGGGWEGESEKLMGELSTRVAQYPCRDCPVYPHKHDQQPGGNEEERAGGAETLSLRQLQPTTPSSSPVRKEQLLQRPINPSHKETNNRQVPNQCVKHWIRDNNGHPGNIAFSKAFAAVVGEGSPSDLIASETVSASEEEEDQEEIKVTLDQEREEKGVESERARLKFAPQLSPVSLNSTDRCMASSGIPLPIFPLPLGARPPSTSTTTSSSSPSSSPTSFSSPPVSPVISTASQLTMVVASSPVTETKASDMETSEKSSPLPTTEESDRDPLFDIPGVVNPTHVKSLDGSTGGNSPKKASIPLRQRQLPASFWKEPKPELKRGLSSSFELHPHKGLVHARGSFLLPYSLGTQAPKGSANSLLEYKALVDLYGSHYAGLVSGGACDVPRASLTQSDYLMSHFGSKLPSGTDSAEVGSLATAASAAAAFGAGGLYPWTYGLLHGDAEKVAGSRLPGHTPHHPPPHPPPPPPHQSLHSHQPSLQQVAGHSGINLTNSGQSHINGHSLLYPHRHLGLGPASGHLSNTSIHSHHGSGVSEATSLCSSWDPMATLSQAQSLLRHPSAMTASSNLWRPIPTKTLTSFHSRFHPFPDVHRSMIDHALP